MPKAKRALSRSKKMPNKVKKTPNPVKMAPIFCESDSIVCVFVCFADKATPSTETGDRLYGQTPKTLVSAALSQNVRKMFKFVDDCYTQTVWVQTAFRTCLLKLLWKFGQNCCRQSGQLIHQECKRAAIELCSQVTDWAHKVLALAFFFRTHQSLWLLHCEGVVAMRCDVVGLLYNWECASSASAEPN